MRANISNQSRGRYKEYIYFYKYNISLVHQVILLCTRAYDQGIKKMMLLKNIFGSYKFAQPFAGLQVYNWSGGFRSITSGSLPLYIHMTNTLLGEPLKRKKRIDPNVIKRREERRKKKLQKQIRRMERVGAATLKPIEEMQIPVKLVDQLQIRTRSKVVSNERESEANVLLEKTWANYRHKIMQNEIKSIEGMLLSQKLALQELKTVSYELYSKAATMDVSMLPYRAKGPTNTPPKKNYYCPDGLYVDKTIVYPGEAE